jgi:hypothetical protein
MMMMMMTMFRKKCVCEDYFFFFFFSRESAVHVSDNSIKNTLSLSLKRKESSSSSLSPPVKFFLSIFYMQDLLFIHSHLLANSFAIGF